jgi:hypothetical protein
MRCIVFGHAAIVIGGVFFVLIITMGIYVALLSAVPLWQ